MRCERIDRASAVALSEKELSQALYSKTKGVFAAVTAGTYMRLECRSRT
jgi:hypothetical protein